MSKMLRPRVTDREGQERWDGNVWGWGARRKSGRLRQAEGMACAKACSGKGPDRCEHSCMVLSQGGEPGWGEAAMKGRGPIPGRWKCDSSAQESNLGQGYRFADYLQKDNWSQWAHQGRERKVHLPHLRELRPLEGWQESPVFCSSQKGPPLAIIPKKGLFTCSSTTQFSQAQKLFIFT